MTQKPPAPGAIGQTPQNVPARHKDGSSRTAPDPSAEHPSPEGENIEDAGEPWGNNFA